MKTARLFLSPLRRTKSRRDGTLLTVCFSLREMKTAGLFLSLVLAFFFCANLSAQVTVGGLTEPKAGTILDLNSTARGGLILSNVTIINPELIPYDANAFPGITNSTDADVNPGLRGAMVYNTGVGTTVTAGIYIWNGYCWTKDGGDITVTAPSITANGLSDAAVTAVDGDPVIFAVVSPQADVNYQWFSNTSASTSGGTPEGTGNSFTTPALTAGTYYYYCTATSASCPSFNAVSSVITVTVIPDPLSLPAGDGEFSGKNCFDVVQINDNAECGLKANRESKKHSFSVTPTETYTFTPIGSPTGLMFACKNLDAAHPVIKSISQNGNEVTVTFYPGLDAAAAGLTRTEALKAELYAVFMDGAVQKQLTVTLNVSDCLCCPGLFISGGEYNNIAMTTTLPSGTTTLNSNGSAANTLLNSTDPNGFANNKSGYGLCYYYRDANSSGTGGVTSTHYTWHNAVGSSLATSPYDNGGVCQTTEGIDAADAHSDWRLPNLGELAQIGQLVSNNTFGGINAGIGSQTEINKAISGETGYTPYGSLPTGSITTTSGTYNMVLSNFWSSTEYDAAFAWSWAYYVNARNAYNYYKTYDYFVRCVRRF